MAAQYAHADAEGFRDGRNRGSVLAAGRLLHPFFPINKNLWTSTFVLFTAGFAMIFCRPVLLDCGYPRLAKMGFSIPSVWYECHRRLCDFRPHRQVERHFLLTARGRRTTWHGYVYTNLFATLANRRTRL